MNKVKSVFVLLLIIAVVSLGLTGCKQKSEHPSGEQSSEEQPSKEQSAEEQPSEEHPSKEHPK